VLLVGCLVGWHNGPVAARGLGLWKRPATYRIAGAELLLCSDDGSAALGGVELALASHDGLSGCAAAAGLTANLCDGVPVV
jgi:hypothetical protein